MANLTESETDSKLKKELMEACHVMEVDDIKCGLGCCSPKWLQKLACKEVYMVIYCIVGITIGSFSTYTTATLSTIEKRFKLTSTQTGLMLSANDIAQISLAILISYFGNYGNRPRLLGIGFLCASVSSFLTGAPHVIYGPGEDAENFIDSLSNNTISHNDSLLNGTITSGIDEFCYAPNEEQCEGEESQLIDSVGPLLIMAIGQFLVGITSTLFAVVGFVYLDDSINRREKPIYYSLSMIVKLIGPVVGLFMGSKCLSIYITPAYMPNISPRDPRWLGAWWLGYFILSFVYFCCAVALILFPKILPNNMVRRIKAIHSETKGEEVPLTPEDLRHYIKLATCLEENAKPSLKDLRSSLKRIFTDKIFVGYNLNVVISVFGMMGAMVFQPKYLEFQFRRSASVATFYTGVSGFFASILGFGGSGIVLRIFRPGPRVITGYSIFLTLFGSLIMFVLTFIGCPKINIEGPMSWSPDIGSCNIDCGCSARYSPVCSTDGKTVYYSPCYAGCTASNHLVAPVEYNNCECINSQNQPKNLMYNITMNPGTDELFSSMDIPLNEGGNAIGGYCPDDCNDSFSTYMIVATMGRVITATGRVGSFFIYLRAMDGHDIGIALGSTSTFMSLFAFFPAPIVFGAIIDSACIIWDTTCGKQGNCWLYDSDRFRMLIHIVPAALLLISIWGDIILYINSKELILYGDDDPEKPTTEEQTPQEKG